MPAQQRIHFPRWHVGHRTACGRHLDRRKPNGVVAWAFDRDEVTCLVCQRKMARNGKG